MSTQKNFDIITPIVISFNEEDNIDRTLSRLIKFKEVILLDSISTDRTQSIASTYPNVRICERKFDNLMNQWNHGHTLTNHHWILSLDADYQISDALLREIEQLELNLDAYSAAFIYCIYGHPLRGTTLPPRIILYDKRKCWYGMDGHAQFLHVNGRTGMLKQPVLHDDHKPLKRWLDSQNLYADQEYEKLHAPGYHPVGVDRWRMKTVLTPFLVLGYTLFVKRGILDGKRGMFYALQRMYAELLFLLKRIDDSLKRSMENEEQQKSRKN